MSQIIVAWKMYIIYQYESSLSLKTQLCVQQLMQNSSKLNILEKLYKNHKNIHCHKSYMCENQSPLYTAVTEALSFCKINGYLLRQNLKQNFWSQVCDNFVSLITITSMLNSPSIVVVQFIKTIKKI